MNLKLKDLTKKEWDLLANEFLERITDLLYMKGKELIIDTLKNTLGDRPIGVNDEITYTYQVGMVGGDIYQVIRNSNRGLSRR